MHLRFWRTRKKKITAVSLHLIRLESEVVPYTLRISEQARNVRIAIHKDGKVRVTSPKFLPKKIVEGFLKEKSSWILSNLNYYKTLPTKSFFDSKKEYQTHKEEAFLYVQKKIKELNTHYKFSYNEIHIKNHKTLWGSCSRKRNLNFNYKIIKLPEKMADYIIVHELCHLQEFNHGKHFWDLVAETIPNYLELRKELKMTGLHSG